jgi:hypothetical protein
LEKRIQTRLDLLNSYHNQQEELRQKRQKDWEDELAYRKKASPT